MFFQRVDLTIMFDFPVFAICACSESDGLTQVFCFMTIVVSNYNYVNWIHEVVAHLKANTARCAMR